MYILIWPIIFGIGIVFGFLLKWALYRVESVGIINVHKEEDKTLYSLDLHIDPEDLQFKSEVAFVVKNSV